MFARFIYPGLLLVAAFGAAHGGAALEHGNEWIVVKLERPLEAREPDGSFSVATGHAQLDAAIVERGVHRIDHALAGSLRAPRNRALMERHGLDRIYRFHVPHGANIDEVVLRFAMLPGVEFAEPDHVNRLAGTIVPDDTRFDDQWYHDQLSDADMDSPEAWNVTTGDPVIVAVLDSGTDIAHSEFSGKVVDPWDFVNNDAVPQDDFDHGMRVSSLAAAITNNASGMAGACWGCRLMPLKVFNDEGLGVDTWFADALVWAADRGATVANYSAIGPHSQTKVTGIRYAAEAGMVVVSVSGNNAPSVQIPGAYREVVAVGASDELDQLAPFSNTGEELDVVAPGDFMLVLRADGSFGEAEGTSYAAPLVSGLVGLVKSVHGSMGREEARQLVQAGADDQVGGDLPGWDSDFGFGRVNMHDTLVGAQSAATLRVQGGASTRLFYDVANPLADSYDFIRGDLDALGVSGAVITLGPVVCLENDSADPDTTGDEDTATPFPGEAFFYLGRFNYGAWPGSYGGSSRNLDRLTPEPALVPDWLVAAQAVRANFGAAVGTAGDVNGDGYDDVIVGAPEYPAPGGTGAAYAYHGSSSGLSTSSAWSIFSDEDLSRLGTVVASAGDVNGDGYDDVVVGETRFDGATGDEGRAVVYLGSALGLETTVHRTLRDPQQGAWFGLSVASAGDVNGDGYDDVLVAAERYDDDQNNEGRSYLYMGSDTGLSGIPDWTFESDQGGARIRAVSSAGDVNNDGYDDVLVGSALYDGVDNREGRAWLFHGSSTGLPATPTQALAGSGDRARFGSTVAPAGDVDNDGYDDVVITALGHTNGEFEEGAAFLFMGSSSGLSTPAAWSFETDQAAARVHSASGAGDVNGDGYDDVIVGSDLFRQARLNEGKALIFPGSMSGLSTTPLWTEHGWRLHARFAGSATTAGDVDNDGHADVIVGARGYDNGVLAEGSALLYHGSATPMSVTQPDVCDEP